MAAHDSQYPGETKPKTIRIDASGISTNWRNFIGTMIILLGGGGSYAGFALVTESQLDERIATEQKARQDGDTKNEKAIVGLTAKVDSVQEVQHMDIAHREARRIIDEKIRCRETDTECNERKALEIERIRRINMRRLKAKRPKEPCSNLACD